MITYLFRDSRPSHCPFNMEDTNKSKHHPVRSVSADDKVTMGYCVNTIIFSELGNYGFFFFSRRKNIKCEVSRMILPGSRTKKGEIDEALSQFFHG